MFKTRLTEMLGIPHPIMADARGFAAALCYGTAGVLIGTRFVATDESTMHEMMKKRYLEVTERDTTLIM